MTEKATFSMGCFWGPDEYFSDLPGVISTTVGYAGGTTEHPTYDDIGDHTETIDIEFDPSVITYQKLLDAFVREHDPTYKAKTQYKSIIFYHTDEQKKAAEKILTEIQGNTSRPVVTELHPAGVFTKAEEYHQKYLRKNRGAVC
jgi:peptide-methionine (S)-S-oxide reductase